MLNNNLQSNDFNDEILVLDESGEFKILSGGELKSYDLTVGSRKSEVKTGILATSPKLTIIMDTGMEEPMLQPPPPVVRKATASFYFHPEDEEEAAKFKEIPDSSSGKRYSLDKILYKTRENYQLDIKSELFSRFRNIVFSFLRDRRTLVDTQEALSRSKENGGLNLPLAQAEKVLIFLKEIKEKIAAEKGLVVDEKTESQPKIFPAPLVEVQELKPLPKIEEIKPPPSVPKFQRPIKEGTITDVKKDYKLVGPIEELGNLSLETFRMLGQNPSERARKILNRLELLGEKSLVKKAAGIKAWRNSPLYKMYLAIGQASLEHNVDITQIIEQSKLAGRDLLTLEEFEIISDINKSLRF